MLGRMWGSGALVPCRWECKLVRLLCKSLGEGVLKKSTLELLWSSNPPSVSVPEVRAGARTDVCTPVFTAV